MGQFVLELLFQLVLEALAELLEGKWRQRRNRGREKIRARRELRRERRARRKK